MHPPTAKLLIAGGVWALRLRRRGPGGSRPALAGILLAPVFLLLARRVLATERAALFATLLLLLDGVYLVQSRIAMTNVFAVLFQLLSALLLLRAVLEPRLRAARDGARGLALGLALSTRWTSLWAWGFLGLVFLAVRGRRAFSPRELALGALGFVALPAVVYLLSYVPWMRQGTQRVGRAPHAAGHLGLPRQPDRHPHLLQPLVDLALAVPAHLVLLVLGRGLRARASSRSATRRCGGPSVPVSLWALVTGFRWRDPRRVFCGAGFFLLYLPWGLSPRTLNFSHYLFEAIPYACLSLGVLLDRRWDRGQAVLARGYVVLVAAAVPAVPALPHGDAGADRGSGASTSRPAAGSGPGSRPGSEKSRVAYSREWRCSPTR